MSVRLSGDDIVDFLRDYAWGDRGLQEDYLVRRLNEAADEIERLRAALDQEQHAASFIAEAKDEIEELRRVRYAEPQDLGNDGRGEKDTRRAGDRTADRQIPPATAGK